jgi:hypothetical protein
MFATKRRLRERLADEKARNEILRQQLKDTAEERDSWKWAASRLDQSRDDLIICRTRERDNAVRNLATTENQLGEARQRLELSDRVKRSAARDAAEAIGQSIRYRSAWLSARRRAHGEAAETAVPSRCATCGSLDVVYHHRDDTFSCIPCSLCHCRQTPCVRTGINDPAVSSEAAAAVTP